MFTNVRPCTFVNFEFFSEKPRFCIKPLTSCQEKRYFSFAKIRRQLMYKEAHQLMSLFNSDPRIHDYHNNVGNQAAEKSKRTVQ